MVWIRLLPILATATDWLTLPVIAASIVLALLAVAMMFVRTSPAGGDDSERRQPRYVDPVLMISAAGVIVLALAAWLLR